MMDDVDTVGGLYLATERKHARTAVLQRFERSWQATPDWRFWRSVIRVGLYLRERLGIGPGDHVALFGPVSAEWLIADWATVAQGAVTVVLDPGLPDAALRAAWEQTSPRVAFVAEAGPLRRLASIANDATTTRKVILGDVAVSRSTDDGVLSFTEILDLGGTLDTAERAGAFRDLARAIAKGSVACVHAVGASDASAACEHLTHADVLARYRRNEHAPTTRPDDITYVHPDAQSLEAHIVLYGSLGDGLTRLALGTPGREGDEIARLDPGRVIERMGLVERLVRRAPTPETAKRRGWLERLIRVGP